jgi:DNA-binding NarL/FixJ family response regulator
MHNQKTKMNILIVDDHPLNVESYASLLATAENTKEAQLHQAFDCKQAYDCMANCKHNAMPLDLALIDISLPPYEEKELFSGDDVAALIQEAFPNCKIIIISMHNEPAWVDRIIKRIQPQVFIAKSDINFGKFSEIIKDIDNNQLYYSQTIVDARNKITGQNLDWDKHDKKILELLAKGTMTKDLPNLIPLSLSAIEKRKNNMKKQLLFKGGTDIELLNSAEKAGILNLFK